MSAVWKSQIAEAITSLQVGALQGVREACEDLLREASAVVPYDTGDLDRSGQASAHLDGDAAIGTVSYDTPYAVIQHETLEFRHDPGRIAKYLALPTRTGARRRQDHIARTIAKNLGT